MKTHIIFDLGQVLINWFPEAAFQQHFDDEAAMKAWFEKIDFNGWNRKQDGGRSFAEGLAAAHAAHGDLAAPLDDYLDRFGLTITQSNAGTWEIAENLKANGHDLYAITNWAAETWPEARRRYPRLDDLFEDILVSGIEGMLKPDPGIYLTLCQRNGLRPQDCLFIDDSAANVQGAIDVGMDAIHFTSAGDLRNELTVRGIA
ncbi:HAD family hydrolase [Paracoccus fistulariae]|uniref:HAD family phosphatase n=1 Tax=Paracoccus fistulariae TaxID=658446 RepID=A0ABY7SMD5_9RHOB|nr:HAD family phosphatase [Paracoccus fistulariae]MDB6180087.1 HAD family phosphatase [Paracoccus fistulariae]WCR08175.1 HAD family phosphatase [Paracoccus fistulariae]